MYPGVSRGWRSGAGYISRISGANHEAFSPDTPMESTSRFSIGVFHQESEIKTKIEIESNIKSKLRKPNDKDNNHGSDQNKALYFSTNIYSHNPPNKQGKKNSRQAGVFLCQCHRAAVASHGDVGSSLLSELHHKARRHRCGVVEGQSHSGGAKSSRENRCASSVLARHGGRRRRTGQNCGGE